MGSKKMTKFVEELALDLRRCSTLIGFSVIATFSNFLAVCSFGLSEDYSYTQREIYVTGLTIATGLSSILLLGLALSSLYSLVLSKLPQTQSPVQREGDER